MSKLSIRVALAVVVGGILAVTLLPASGEATPMWCEACGERGVGGVAHVLVNIILFAPFGALLALAGVRRRWNWLSGGLLSSLIECAQLFIPGRFASIDDVLWNTTGTIVGSLMPIAVLGWLRRSAHPATAAALAPAGAVVLAVAATGWLLRPRFPRDIDYYVQWAPVLGDVETYRGRVLRAELGSVAVPSGRLLDTPRVRSLLIAGAPLRVQVVAGPPVRNLATVFGVNDGVRDVVLFGLDRNDFVLRYLTRAYAWGLEQGDLRLRGAAHTLAQGATLNLAMWRKRGQLCLRFNARRTCHLGFTPGRGWAFLIPPDGFPEWLHRLMDLSWIGGLLFLVGFVSRGDRNALLVGGGVSLLGLAVLPPLVGLLNTPPLEFLAAVAGQTAGAVAYTVFARRAQTSAAGVPTQ